MLALMADIEYQFHFLKHYSLININECSAFRKGEIYICSSRAALVSVVRMHAQHDKAACLFSVSLTVEKMRTQQKLLILFIYPARLWNSYLHTYIHVRHRESSILHSKTTATCALPKLILTR